MGTVMIIVLGIVAISVVAVLGDTIGNIAKAKARAQESMGSAAPAEIAALKDRIGALEARVDERDDSVRKLQDELRFVSRMLEDKTSGRS
jgi:hypothetical protein